MSYKEANDVLNYWYGGGDPSKRARWFGGGEEGAREIREKFGDLVRKDTSYDTVTRAISCGHTTDSLARVTDSVSLAILPWGKFYVLGLRDVTRTRFSFLAHANSYNHL